MPEDAPAQPRHAADPTPEGQAEPPREAATALPPADWYADPNGELRWWNGAQWTRATRTSAIRTPEQRDTLAQAVSPLAHAAQAAPVEPDASAESDGPAARPVRAAREPAAGWLVPMLIGGASLAAAAVVGVVAL